ncbi:unnamed protein product [Rhizophagus irregularis]|nr:unnamed protein product [Rhizophagus irregularis]CAB4430232.1 unnamed protein product [Rhizophagus irregularis]
MTRVRKEQKTTMQNEAEVTKGRGKNGGGRGRGRGRGCGRDHSSDIHQPIESSVSSTQVLKTTAVIKCDTPIQEYEAEADLNVISISDDELGPAFDDTLNDFSISGPFKLDYSTIMDNSEKICDDDHEIETERDIRPFYIYSLTMYILKI